MMFKSRRTRFENYNQHHWSETESEISVKSIPRLVTPKRITPSRYEEKKEVQ